MSIQLSLSFFLNGLNTSRTSLQTSILKKSSHTRFSLWLFALSLCPRAAKTSGKVTVGGVIVASGAQTGCSSQFGYVLSMNIRNNLYQGTVGLSVDNTHSSKTPMVHFMPLLSYILGALSTLALVCAQHSLMAPGAGHKALPPSSPPRHRSRKVVRSASSGYFSMHPKLGPISPGRHYMSPRLQTSQGHSPFATIRMQFSPTICGFPFLNVDEEHM